MNDPLSALKQFTPVAANRDELLFAAGRASAPKPSRFWKWATLGLALSQLLTVSVGLWFWPTSPTAATPLPTPIEVPVPASPTAEKPETPVTPVEPVTPAVEEVPASPTPVDPYSYLALMHHQPAPVQPVEGNPRPSFRLNQPLQAGNRQYD